MTHRAPLYTRIERRSTQVELLTWINVGLLQTTLRPADAMPFSATDWPVPQRRQFPTALLQWQDSLLEIAIPIGPTDWPNPVERGPDIGLYSWHVNLLQSTLAPAAPVVTPFAYGDWPLPEQRRALQTDAQVNLLETTLAFLTDSGAESEPVWRRRFGFGFGF